jgi:hypothetical protein
MKFYKTILAAMAFALSSSVVAGTISYESFDNSWTFSGFEKSGLGTWVNTGNGGIEGSGGTVFGGGSASINTFSGGQWVRRGTALADYYFPVTEAITVQNVTWSNTIAAQLTDLGDGILFFGAQGTHSWADAPVDGTILNGTFSYADGSVNGNVIYEFNPSISPVPVPAAVWLFGTALIGFVGMSRRRKVA